MKILIVIIQAACIIAIAPMVSGIIKKLKNTMRMRRGAPVLQPYYNLAKYFAKNEIVSKQTSWIFAVTPYVLLASSVTALLIVPAVFRTASFGAIGDMLAIVFILALGRFFLALAGLDAGSSFGGMGSSREMFISAFAEPAILVAFFAVGFVSRTTNPAGLYLTAAQVSPILAAAAMFLVMLAETSRIPVDNQETHLELTMVHEAMVLEYSGRQLATVELASYIKQMIFYSLIAMFVLPAASGNNMLLGILFYASKILMIAAIVAFIEVTVAKMRLFRVIDFLAFAYALAGMAVITAIMGY